MSQGDSSFELEIVISNLQKQGFPIRVRPSTSMADIKASPEMAAFFERANTPLDLSRLSAIRAGQLRGDHETIESLAIPPGQLFFLLRNAPISPSPVATPALATSTTAVPAVATGAAPVPAVAAIATAAAVPSSPARAEPAAPSAEQVPPASPAAPTATLKTLPAMPSPSPVPSPVPSPSPAAAIVPVPAPAEVGVASPSLAPAVDKTGAAPRRPIFEGEVPAPDIVKDDRELAYVLMARVGTQAREATQPDGKEVFPNADGLPDMLYGIKLTINDLAEVNHDPSPLNKLANFVTLAPAEIAKMTDDIAQVFRTFMAAMIRINTDLNGHTTNPTIEDHFIGLLRELFEMQRSISGQNELAESLAPVYAKIKAREPIIELLNQEYSKRKETGDGVYEHMEKMVQAYDEQLADLKQISELIAAYKLRYNDFPDPNSRFSVYQQQIHELEIAFQQSSEECQLTITKLNENRHTFQLAATDALEQLRLQEEDVKRLLEAERALGAQYALELLVLLRKEGHRAAKIKVYEAKLDAIDTERKRIVNKSDQAYKNADSFHNALLRKIADNDLCKRSVRAFGKAATETTGSLGQTTQRRKKCLLADELDASLACNSSYSAVYKIVSEGRTSSLQEAEQHQKDHDKLTHKLDVFRLQRVFAKIQETNMRLQAIDAMIGPCANRIAVFGEKLANYDHGWHTSAASIRSLAASLNWLAPTEPGSEAIVISKPEDELEAGQSIPTYIKLEHPTIELQREEESRKLILSEIFAKRGDLRMT